MWSPGLLRFVASQQRRRRELEAYLERKRLQTDWGVETGRPGVAEETELKRLRAEVEKLRKEVDLLLAERTMAARRRMLVR